MRGAWAIALLLAIPAVPGAAAGGCAAASEYHLSAVADEVREADGQQLELAFSRTGDTACKVVTNVRLLEGELDFKGPFEFPMTLAAGSATTHVYLEVLDDNEPEPTEAFTVTGDLHVYAAQRADYEDGFVQGHVSIQANDGYAGALQPRIAFADDARANRTTLLENSSWYPRFVVSFPPVENTIVTLQLDNGTCAECRVFGYRFQILAHERTVTLLGKLSPEVWSPDDNRSEPPESACLRISAPGMRVGPPRAIVVVDDDNRTRAPLNNRTLLLRTGLDNATVDHLWDPCGLPVHAPKAPTPRATSAATKARPADAAAADAGPGVPRDSPLLQTQQAPAPVAALAALALLGLAATRRRRA